MEFNIKSLIPEFKEYLVSSDSALNLEKLDSESNASIFLEHGDNFKKFVSEKYGADLSDLNLDIEDVKKAKIEEGKFVIDESEPSEDKEEINANLALEVLNELLDDDEIVKFLDENTDGKLSQEEILNFATFLANYDDEDLESISFNEILNGAKAVMNGEYLTDISQDEQDIDVSDSFQSPSSSSTSLSSGSIGGNYNSNYSNNSSTKTNQTTASTTQSPATNKEVNANSSLNDLEQARNSKASDLSQSYADLKTSQQEHQTALQKQDEALKNALEAQNDLTQAEKDMLTLFSEKITGKKMQISDSKEKIADYESQISSTESSIAVVQAAIQSCKDALGSIPAPPEGEEDPYAGKRQKLTNMIAQYEKQLQELQAQLDDKNQLRDDEQKALSVYEEELKEIENDENGQKAKYDEFMNQLKQDSNSEFAIAANAVSAAEAKISNLQTNITTQEAQLAKLEGFVKDRIKSDVTKMASSPDSKIFADGPLNYEAKNMSGNTKLPYGVLIPEGADPNEPMPVMVFLHGMGEYSNLDAAGRVINNDLTQNGLDGFNGYVIYPSVASGGSWQNQAGNIDQILNDFASQYSIDPENIVLTGHSLGGSGVISTLQSQTFNDGQGYEFKKGAALTGYIGLNSAIDTPMAVYADGGSYQPLQNVLNKLDLSEGGKDLWFDWRSESHGLIDDKAYAQDADGDGRSDLIEWLYDVEE